MTGAGADRWHAGTRFYSCVYTTLIPVRFRELSIYGARATFNDRAGITERATDARRVEALGRNAREANKVLTVARPQAN